MRRFRFTVVALIALAVAGLVLPVPAAAAPACTITGTSGPDRLVGTAGDDVICGLRGDDVIHGRGGDDVIRGGKGDDKILGQAGDDRLYGGPGHDRIHGGGGNDWIYGGGGNDWIHGGLGTNLLNGGPGDNTIIKRGWAPVEPKPEPEPDPPAPPPPPGRWADPAGDQQPGAPDITTVTAGDGSGLLTFRVATPGTAKLAGDILLNIGLDTDLNSSTGKQQGNHGIEYVVALDVDEETQQSYLGRWNGNEWDWLEKTEALVVHRWDSGATVTISLDDIGSPSSFNFWVGVWDGENGDSTEIWTYRVGSATATHLPLLAGAFTITYENSADFRTQSTVDRIRESEWLEYWVWYLNRDFALPEDVTVVVEEDTFGPAYWPEYRVITMPPEFLQLADTMFRGVWNDRETELLRAEQAFSWVFLHEAAHALIDILDLPITGLEEDSADQFATYYAFLYEWPWVAYDGALLFRQLGRNRGNPQAADYWDEHSLHEQRHTNIFCWLYGYDPYEFVFIPTRFPEAQNRLGRCGFEYQQMVESWERLLAPHTQ